MAESRQHKEYVLRIVTFIGNLHGCCRDLIEADLEGYNTRTTQVGGKFFPDVYYRDFNTLIIGEAKTDDDIENTHTYNQLDCYIDEALHFNGNKYIILSTSFYSSASFYNLIARIKNRMDICDIKFFILDNIRIQEV